MFAWRLGEPLVVLAGSSLSAILQVFFAFVVGFYLFCVRTARVEKRATSRRWYAMTRVCLEISACLVVADGRAASFAKRSALLMWNESVQLLQSLEPRGMRALMPMAPDPGWPLAFFIAMRDGAKTGSILTIFYLGFHYRLPKIATKRLRRASRLKTWNHCLHS